MGLIEKLFGTRSQRELKAIRKAKTVAEYLPAAQRLLRDCPLRENAVIET